MVELVDTHGSEPCRRKAVRVQLSLSAQIILRLAFKVTLISNRSLRQLLPESIEFGLLLINYEH